MYCPSCGNEQFYCKKRNPEIEVTQIYMGNDAISCGYCGFTEHIDFWEDLGLGKTSLTKVEYVEQALNMLLCDVLSFSKEQTESTIKQIIQEMEKIPY